VEADGRRLAESPLLQFGDSFSFDVPLDHVREIQLVVEAPEGISTAHANWCDPEIETCDGKIIRCGLREVPPVFPVGFRYGNLSSMEFFALHGFHHASEEKSDHTLHRFISESESLRMTVELKAWNEFPVWEWQTAFENPSGKKSERLYDIHSIRMNYSPGCPNESKLLRSHGSFNTDSHKKWPGDGFRDSFTPVHCIPVSGDEFVFGAVGGRPSDEWLPCFDIETGSENLRVVLGWAGQWQASVKSTGNEYRIHAGLEDADLVLEPGERIQVASAILLYTSEGGNDKAVNLWRRFATEKIMLPLNGEPPSAPLSYMSWGGLAEKGHLERIAGIEKRNLPVDVYWIDAGWFAPESPNEFSPEWAANVGDWDFNRDSFPQELRNVEQAVHQSGRKLLLWFEPERVRTDRKLAKEHPEYLIFNDSKDALLDLGNPDAWQWCFDKISGIIERNNLDWYRQDFNFQPLGYWRKKDTSDRKGMTEIRYVAGLYRFWRELRRKFPRLMIDNCASGGRRLDFELLRYGMPLWYSDMQCHPRFNPEYSLTHIAGMARYWPRFGGGVQNPEGGDTYNFRASMNAALGIHCFYGTAAPVSDDYPFDWLRARLKEYREVRDCFTGDYYCLAAPSGTGDGMWTAMQYDLPNSGRGLLTVFRGPQSPVVECTLILRGLEGDAEYLVEDTDRSFDPVTLCGKSLMETGLSVRIPTPRTARLIRYKRI
jgi:alpha-galactosidase